MTITKITYCDNCPLWYEDDSGVMTECKHPNGYEGGLTGPSKKEAFDNCPLKKEPLMIALSNAENLR